MTTKTGAHVDFNKDARVVKKRQHVFKSQDIIYILGIRKISTISLFVPSLTPLSPERLTPSASHNVGRVPHDPLKL